MSRQQKEKLLKTRLRDKKLLRLFNHSEITEQDHLIVNYAYEEMMNLKFFYSFCFPMIPSYFVGFKFFGNYSNSMKMIAALSFYLLLNFKVREMVEVRFRKITDPYLEKYAIR